MAPERNVYVTENDLARLEAIVNGGSSTTLELLHDELLRATVVRSQEIPPNVVTMNSRVRFRDLETNEESEATLVYPGSADVDAGRLSITAPVGAALFGLSVGEEIEWPVPNGKTRKLKILDVLFQPEAAGRFDL
jgi:regulator of nucleoside diphosphate kinase